MSSAPLTGARRLREMLKDPKKMVVCPGVFDGLTARIALSKGFDAMYMTGAGTSMSKLGWADLGMATLNDMRGNAEMIASLDPSVPLIADADTGYGGPIMVSRTVTQYSRAGVAALHIEDQVQEKRCGHLMGKEIVDREIYYSRLRAAVHTRNKLQSDMMIIARTDALQKYGFEEALERLKEAVRIGVDIVFLEALRSKEEAKKVCQVMGDVPVLLNVVPGGTTPDMTIEEAKEVGFRIMIFPAVCLAAVATSVGNALDGLQEERGIVQTNGTNGHSTGVKSLFNLCGLQECIDLDKQAGGKAYADVGK